MTDAALEAAVDAAAASVWGDSSTWGTVAWIIAPQVAVHLAGRDVELHWRDLADPLEADGRRRGGLCYRRGKTAVIEIRPDLRTRGAVAYGVFLHEVAHARLHAATYADTLAPPHTPDYHPTSYAAGWVANRASRHEIEAQAQADLWERWAEKHALRDTVAGRLLALLLWSG